MTKTVNTALIGFGNVGRNFLHIMEMKGDLLRTQYGLEFRIVCLADSSGVAVSAGGYDGAAVRASKQQGGRVAQLPGYQAGRTPADVLAELPFDLLLEASPVNLVTGEPGLSAVRAALSRGIPAVLANKGPLVLAFHELDTLARQHGAGLGFSATVCGALPVINIGRRDLVAADITLLRGIFNATTNFTLDEMAGGRAYADALAEAQRRGIAETDPSLDVEGWDTANKLVIIANSFLGVQVTLSDVQVEGITKLTAEDLRRALDRGNTVKLLATAAKTTGGYRLSVAPTVIAKTEFLGSCDGWEMGIEIESDLYGKQYYKIWEREPLPTAAAMLRDAIGILTS